MSKRNFVLLIIILAVVSMAVFGFLFFRESPTPPTDDSTGTNFFSQFNPFGTSTPAPQPTPPPPADVSGIVPPPPPEIPVYASLTKVSSMPTAGFGVYMKERLIDMPIIIPVIPPAKPTPPPTEFVPAIRYVEIASGNIYQTFADKIEERKFSGTTIPRVYDAYFGNRGETVVMRYLKQNGETIETFVGTLPKEPLGADTVSTNEIKGTFLPNNVKDLSVSPDNSKIFYMFESGEDLIGTTLNFLDNKKVQIFDSAFTEWLSQWASSNMITVTTKPSANIPGFMYAIDPAKKNLTNVLGNINGLTTLASPNGKLILYGDNNLSLNVYHTDTRNSDILGVRTLPEKCVWGRASDSVYCAVPKSIPVGQYPDTWYQGEISFSDQLWKIDIKTGNTTLMQDPVTVIGGEDIDGVKLATDDGENYLFFINKKDSYLWKLDLR